jgi:hypothetical protein
VVSTQSTTRYDLLLFFFFFFFLHKTKTSYKIMTIEAARSIFMRLTYTTVDGEREYNMPDNLHLQLI